MSGESDPVSIVDNGDVILGVAGYDVTSFATRFLQDVDDATQRRAWERVTAPAAKAFISHPDLVVEQVQALL